MHEPALARAALPEPAIVLEMLLRPLSLGHVLQFSRHGILQSIASESLTPEQLASAVFICCRSWSESLDNSPDFLSGIKFWAWRRRVKNASKRHSKSGQKDTYHDVQLSRFGDYLRYGAAELPVSDAPRSDRQSAGRSPGSPFILRLHQWLMEYLRLTEEQAWDYGFGLAKMRWACHWESQGGIDIMNEADESFNRFISEQEAKLTGGN